MTGSKSVLIAMTALLLTACSSGTASVPPCNAMLFLFGTMDVTLDCPAHNALPLLQRGNPN